MRVIAILASHNRRERIERCLESYFAQKTPAGWALGAVVVDDASVDGTAAAIAATFPEVALVRGDGERYWAGGMALAERAALDRAFDALLWLNDDVALDPDAVVRLADVAGATAIAVGATRDPRTAATTYSGVRIKGRHPLRVERVEPGSAPVVVDTFNGNAVLVPKPVHDRVGCLDAAFVHIAADFDYGLRARRLGIPRLLCAGTVGECEANPDPRPWAATGLSRRERLAALVGPKGYPPRSRGRYLRRHGGRAWPVYWVAPYVRAVPQLLRRERG